MRLHAGFSSSTLTFAPLGVRQITCMKSLLLVSSDIRHEQSEVCNGLAPRKDYATLARALDADVFDFGAVLRSTLGRSVKRIGGRGTAHALMASTRLGMYDVVFSDNERVGVFAALILRSMSDLSLIHI